MSFIENRRMIRTVKKVLSKTVSDTNRMMIFIIPRIREREFSIKLFKRYQRSERGPVLESKEMEVSGVSTLKRINIFLILPISIVFKKIFFEEL